MTNVYAFSKWGLPVLASVFALTASTSKVSAETSQVNNKSQKLERLTRSTDIAPAQTQTQLRVRGGKMETRVQDGKLVLTGFAGDVGGGRVHLTGNMPVDKTSEKSADLRFADISVHKASEVIGKPELSAWLGNASLSGTVKGEWTGKGAAQISRSANGALTVVAGKGVITDKEVLKKLGKLAGISDLDKLRFDSMKLTATADNGKVIIKSAQVAGPDLNLAMVGNYSAHNDDLNLKIAMSVSPVLASRSSYLKVKNVLDLFKGKTTESENEGDFVEVPVLLVSGELKKPDVKLDKSRETASATAAEANEQAKTSATPVKAGGFLSSIKQLAKTAE